MQGDFLGWPAGRTVTDYRRLTQDAVGGDVSVLYTPATPKMDDQFMVILAGLNNLDVVTRTQDMSFFAVGGFLLNVLGTQTVLAGTFTNVPNTIAAATTAAPIGAIIVSGTNYLQHLVGSVTALQEIDFSIQLRCLGRPPTITEVIA